MKTKIKGREMQGIDNKQYALSEFFENKNRLRCPECGCLLDPYYRSLRIDFKSKFDFSTTYDNVDIVSKRFKDFIQLEDYRNVVFFPVNENNEFFYFHILNNPVQVNVEKSGIKYKEKCNTCLYPKEIIGGFDIFLNQEEPLLDCFYTSDVYWRTHNMFGYRIFIGIETYNKLHAQKFKGLDLAAKVF